MGRLVCNGSNLYRRSNSLVRTPIKLTLQPSEMAYYSIAGDYTNSGSSVYFPNSGFIAQDTYANEQQMGYNCVQAGLTHSNSLQIWRNVNTAHLPETVWYQGAYATSAPNLNASLQSCEAFMQFGAYKFISPSQLQNLNVTSVVVKFTNGGAVIAYQSAAGKSDNNKRWAQSTEVDSHYFYVNFSAVTSLGHVQHLANNWIAEYDLAAQTGFAKGARDLWGRSGTNIDGGIPTLTAPVASRLSLDSTAISKIAGGLNSGIWIVPYFGMESYSTTNYKPYYWPSNVGYWACVSLWGMTIEVTYE